MAITCPNCQTANSDTGKFCMQCGEPLRQVEPPEHLLTGMLPPNSWLQNRYIITHLLGRGGMGAVYASTDARITGKRWAVKEMSDAAITNPLEKQNALSAFRQEAEMLARLSHPNLPAVTDFFSEEGKQYLVMELVQGKTLADLLEARGAPFPEPQVLRWANQLCDVLHYLHSQDPPIIFRDLKPTNIMLEDTGLIKLIDFGIARHFKPGRAKDTQAMGTPGYAAPEQYGRGQTDARSDVYSLGVTLHNLLTAHDPGTSPFNLPGARQINPAVSRQVEAVIRRATRTNPAERYSTIDAMRRALQAATPEDLAPTEVEFDQPPPPVTPPRPARRLPRWTLLAGGLAAVFLCLLLIAGVMALNSGVLPFPVVAETNTTATSTPTLEADTATPEESGVAGNNDPTSEPDTATPTPTATTPAPTDNPTPTATATPLPVATVSIGQSAGGADLVAYEMGSADRVVLIISGLHAGFAPGTVELANRFVEYFQQNPEDLPQTLRLHIIPNANPDSANAPGELAGRINANGVDLNRNFGCNWSANATWLGQPVDPGSGPFSEPETAALRDYILDLRPEVVIFYEARASNGIVAAGECNDDDSNSGPLVSAYAAVSSYDVFSFTNLTGDSADWVVSQGIRSLSILLKQYTGLSNAEWEANLDGLLAVLNRVD